MNARASIITALLLAATRPPGAVAADPWLTLPGAEGPGAGRHVVLLSGDEEYRSEEALPQLGRILAERHGFTCTVLFAVDPETGLIDPEHRRDIPGLAALEHADLMIIATRFRDLPDEQMAHIDRYVRAGKPIIGMRTATHAFALESSPTYARYSWNAEDPAYEQGFGRQVLGETWIAHHGRHGAESTRGIVAPGAADHPILRGIEPGSIWGPTDVYRVRLPLAGDGTPIVLGAVLDGMSPDDSPVEGERNDPMMPIAWTRTCAGDDGRRGRVFTTTIGAATDLLSGGTRRMLVNAAYWALGMEDAIPPEGTDVGIVGAFAPTDFGFGGHRRGVRPSDHTAVTGAPAADPGGRFVLEPGDSVVVVGNTFAERLALSGYFEALVHAAHPDDRIRVAHVPWSADEVGIRPREMHVPTMEDHLARLEADVVVMCFGMSESFAGEAGIEPFARALESQLDALRAARFNGSSPPRLVLVSPIAPEDLGPPLPTGAAIEERRRVVGLHVEAMRAAAASRGVRFVDLFDVPSAGSRPLTSNGIHPTAHGCYHYARAIGDQLGWIEPMAEDRSTVPESAVRLRKLAADKYWHERLLYRPTNTEYVWGRRHEPFGVVNFPPEMAQLERMIDARQQVMWSMEKPHAAALFAAPPGERAIWETVPEPLELPEDEWSPAPVEARGTETSLGGLEILDPGTFAESFTLPEGYVIECFASEQDFADLANPVAMTFDARGRLWLLCAPTYPHLMPGELPRCALLILEDTDRDGRADTLTVFADRLYIPTGFAVDTDAVYVGQAPDLWKLTDTDGDDRADRREIVASGFGMPDSHHQISAFEWEPNGGFVFHEGVFTKSNVETPWGTRRTRDAATWRFDPRTQRVDVLSHCDFSNPWGHVFDDYGQSVLADASGGDNFAFAHVITQYEYPTKPKRVGALLNRGRPTAGCELISSRHFPDDVQETFLVNQSIGFHGTRWNRIVPDGSAWRAEDMPQDLLASSDTNFRPVAMEIGPDGALYIVDWCNPLIGHMQYSVRDPRRDHAHGRIWRIRHAGRPLLDPPAIGDRVPDLLEQLRLPERNTRQHARRRLQTMPPADVFPELTSWVAALDPADPLHDRLLLETLWIHQARGRADMDLLERVAMLAEPRARAGAVRVLRHWLQQESVDPAEALPLLQRAVDDEDMRVRLEGVVACGFVPDVAGASVAAQAGARPMDDGLRIALQETLAHLARYGEPRSEIARELRLERSPVEDLLEQPLDELTARVRLRRGDVPGAARTEALNFLASTGRLDRARVLVDELTAARRPAAAAAAIGPLLLALPPADLAPAEEALIDAASSPQPALRAAATAALLRAGPEHATLVAGDVRFATEVLALLEPRSAPPAVVEELRDAAGSWLADPVRTVEQAARHARDEAALVAWLMGLVETAEDRGLDRFDRVHDAAMAALRELSAIPAARWPDGRARYRIEPIDAATRAAGRAVYLDEISGCVRCHGPDGRGEEGYPRLDRSPWVLGDGRRAAAAVIHGLYGAITFRDGRAFDAVMEPLGASLDDEQIAAVLSHVRQSWGNFAPAVRVEEVAAARASGDGMPWHADALRRAYPLRRDRLVPAVAAPAQLAAAPASGRLYLFIAVAIIACAGLALLLHRATRRKGDGSRF